MKKLTPILTRLASLGLALAVVPACAADGDGSDGGGGNGSGSSTEPGGPRFLSFGTNRTALDDSSQTLVLSAVLTDPDGVDDIIGGSLKVDGQTINLGTFATAAQEGAYTLTLDWNQLVSPIEDSTQWGENFSMVLRAEFFDQAGHTAVQTVQVKLTCESDDPLRPSRVVGEGCAVGVQCLPTSESGPGCYSEYTNMSGTQMCDQVLGMSCTACYQGNQSAVSCDSTSESIARGCTCN